MNIMRFNPWLPRHNFSDFFNSHLNRSIDNSYNETGREFYPAVNISEREDGFGLEVVVPGMQKKDFSIELHKNILVVSSESDKTVKEDENNSSRYEYYRKSFSRSFRLPESVNSEKLSAKYEDGILYIDLPKSDEKKEQKPKAIAVK